MLLAAWLLISCALAAASSPSPLILAVSGQTNDYLEPCGCGGQQGGGLARRAALLTAWRSGAPALAYLDVGGFGAPPGRRAVVARSLAAMAADGTGLAAADLADLAAVQAALGAAAIPACSLTPPLEQAGGAPPEMLLIERPGWRVAVLSVAFGPLTTATTAERASQVLAKLARDPGYDGAVLISHLAPPATERLLGLLPADQRPLVVFLADPQDEVQPASLREGVVWVPVAGQGRSLSRLELTAVVGAAAGGDAAWRLRRGAREWRVRVDQVPVADGPRDQRVQAWVDAALRQEAAAQAAPTTVEQRLPEVAPAACAGCHAAAVAAWRRQPHARAVDTLVNAGRELAGCLRCHDQALRRTGLRAAATGDRGVTCDACHEGLAGHLARPATARPTTLDDAGCRACHTTAQSPRYEPAAYHHRVEDACRAVE